MASSYNNEHAIFLEINGVLSGGWLFGGSNTAGISYRGIYPITQIENTTNTTSNTNSGIGSTMMFLVTDGTNLIGGGSNATAVGRMRRGNPALGYALTSSTINGDTFNVAALGAAASVLNNFVIVGEDSTANGTIKWTNNGMSTLSNAISGGFSARGYGVAYSQSFVPDADINGIKYFNSVYSQQSSNHPIIATSPSNMNIDNMIFINKIGKSVGIGIANGVNGLEVAGSITASVNIVATSGFGTFSNISQAGSGTSNNFAGNIWQNTATTYISSSGAVYARRGGYSTISIGRITTQVSTSFDLILQRDSAAKPGTNTWSSPSDERVKNFITLADLDVCYSTIKAVPLKYYEWAIPGFESDDKHSLGYIAQDIEKIFPKAVQKVEQYGFDDFRVLNNDQIIKMSHGAVQKLMEKVEALEARVAALESK